jgi:hypothetical protein
LHYQSTKTFKTYQQQSTQSETPFNLVINDNFVMSEFMVFPAAACANHNCFIAERSAYLVNYSKDCLISMKKITQAAGVNKRCTINGSNYRR